MLRSVLIAAALVGATALQLQAANQFSSPLRRSRQTEGKSAKSMYTDGSFPGCARAVIVTAGKITIHGNDGSPSCVSEYYSNDRKSLKEWTAEGYVLEDSDGLGDKIGIDFSARGGEGNEYVEGEFAENEIRWSNGNVWKESKIVERNYIDPNHKGCARNLYFDQGVVTLTAADGPDGGHCEKGNFVTSGTEYEVRGFQHGNQIVLDFSTKGGPKDLEGEITTDGIAWKDGNTWALIPEEETAEEEEVIEDVADEHTLKVQA